MDDSYLYSLVEWEARNGLQSAPSTVNGNKAGCGAVDHLMMFGQAYSNKDQKRKVKTRNVKVMLRTMLGLRGKE